MGERIGTCRQYTKYGLYISAQSGLFGVARLRWPDQGAMGQLSKQAAEAAITLRTRHQRNYGEGASRASHAEDEGKFPRRPGENGCKAWTNASRSSRGLTAASVVCGRWGHLSFFQLGFFQFRSGVNRQIPVDWCHYQWSLSDVRPHDQCEGPPVVTLLMV